jgi:hypothetical protein
MAKTDDRDDPGDVPRAPGRDTSTTPFFPLPFPGPGGIPVPIP